MEFNPDADLDTSNIVWRFSSPNNTPVENVLVEFTSLSGKEIAMVDYIVTLGTAFLQGAIVMLGVFAILAIAAQFIDNRR